ncbi:Uma2 family endonuclease [Kitasatospora sp. NPDC059571]|uniref:Uma2 family endonuclease n=1 Tax=Kitasatospora sp. NPDC059571 TaxID=3346871 RepID=UPI0036752021
MRTASSPLRCRSVRLPCATAPIGRREKGHGRHAGRRAPAACGRRAADTSWSWKPRRAEITSTRPQKDREAKRLGYAAAGIPCCLLIDRDEGQATLFTDPADGDYTAHVQVSFGKPLDLPAPFSFALDTEPLR